MATIQNIVSSFVSIIDAGNGKAAKAFFGQKPKMAGEEMKRRLPALVEEKIKEVGKEAFLESCQAAFPETFPKTELPTTAGKTEGGEPQAASQKVEMQPAVDPLAARRGAVLARIVMIREEAKKLFNAALAKTSKGKEAFSKIGERQARFFTGMKGAAETVPEGSEEDLGRIERSLDVTLENLQRDLTAILEGKKVTTPPFPSEASAFEKKVLSLSWAKREALALRMEAELDAFFVANGMGSSFAGVMNDLREGTGCDLLGLGEDLPEEATEQGEALMDKVMDGLMAIIAGPEPTSGPVMGDIDRMVEEEMAKAASAAFVETFCASVEAAMPFEELPATAGKSEGGEAEPNQKSEVTPEVAPPVVTNEDPKTAEGGNSAPQAEPKPASAPAPKAEKSAGKENVVKTTQWTILGTIGAMCSNIGCRLQASLAPLPEACEVAIKTMAEDVKEASSGADKSLFGPARSGRLVNSLDEFFGTSRRVMSEDVEFHQMANKVRLEGTEMTIEQMVAHLDALRKAPSGVKKAASLVNAAKKEVATAEALLAKAGSEKAKTAASGRVEKAKAEMVRVEAIFAKAQEMAEKATLQGIQLAEAQIVERRKEVVSNAKEDSGVFYKVIQEQIAKIGLRDRMGLLGLFLGYLGRNGFEGNILATKMVQEEVKALKPVELKGLKQAVSDAKKGSEARIEAEKLLEAAKAANAAVKMAQKWAKSDKELLKGLRFVQLLAMEVSTLERDFPLETRAIQRKKAAYDMAAVAIGHVIGAMKDTASDGFGFSNKDPEATALISKIVGGLQATTFKDGDLDHHFAGFSPAAAEKWGLAMGWMLVTTCVGSLYEIGSTYGVQAVEAVMSMRNPKRVESLVKNPSGRGFVTKAAWVTVCVAGTIIIGASDLVRWAFSPVSALIKGGQGVYYWLRSKIAGKDSDKASGFAEKAKGFFTAAKEAICEVYRAPVRLAESIWKKVSGWFKGSDSAKGAADQQPLDDKKADETAKESVMGDVFTTKIGLSRNMFAGLLSQSFGEKKGAAWKDETLAHKAAAVVISPFRAAWRVAKAEPLATGVGVLGGISGGLLFGALGVAGGLLGGFGLVLGAKALIGWFRGRKAEKAATVAPAAPVAGASAASAAA